MYYALRNASTVPTRVHNAPCSTHLNQKQKHLLYPTNSPSSLLFFSSSSLLLSPFLSSDAQAEELQALSSCSTRNIGAQISAVDADFATLEATGTLQGPLQGTTLDDFRYGPKSFIIILFSGALVVVDD
jgi:hypothetical protein